MHLWDSTSPYRRWSSPQISDNCGLATVPEPDRHFVAVGCRDRTTRIRDTGHDRLLAELPSATPVDGDFLSAFPAVSATGDRAAIARGNTVTVYALPEGQVVRTVTHPAAVNVVPFGHDLVSGGIDGSPVFHARWSRADGSANVRRRHRRRGVPVGRPVAGG